MIKNIFSLLVFGAILFGSNAYGQDLFSANALDADDSGFVKTTIHHRDPAGITKDQVSITEDGKVMKIEEFKEIDSTYEDKGEFILILFENHKSRASQSKFFSNVIASSAHEIVDENDEFLFASFDWNRSDLNDGCLDFADPAPTNEPDSLIAYAESVKPKGGNYSRASTLIYRSIIEAIEYLEAIETDKPKAIIVLSGGYSDIYDHENDGTAAKAKALQANIPVYSISLEIGGVADKYNLNSLCTDTYGLSSIMNKDQEIEASDKLIEYVSVVSERAAGKQYEVTHKSSYEKDCKSHDFQISVDGGTPQNITYSTQCISWMEKNGVYVYVGIGVLVLVIVLIFFLIRKNKKERERKDAQHAQKVQEIEAQNKAAKLEIEKQAEALRHKEERDRIQAEKAKSEEAAVQRAEKEKELIAEMQMGGFPRLRGIFQGQSGELFIDHPNVTIGRADHNYFTINHGTVSGSHAEIVYSDGKYTIRDKNSSNGTLVNGEKITEHELQHGDVINLGEVTLTYLK